LSAEARGRLTTLRIAAHVGSVIIRKEGSDWVLAGDQGCSVPTAQIERALDNLTTLKAVPTNEPTPQGSAFELQLVVLVDQERVIYFEIADRNERGDLVSLMDDSLVRLQGFDRALWSPHPADWCGKR
jgi:hypothetical protein